MNKALSYYLFAASMLSCSKLKSNKLALKSLSDPVKRLELLAIEQVLELIGFNKREFIEFFQRTDVNYATLTKIIFHILENCKLNEKDRQKVLLSLKVDKKSAGKQYNFSEDNMKQFLNCLKDVFFNKKRKRKRKFKSKDINDDIKLIRKFLNVFDYNEMIDLFSSNVSLLNNFTLLPDNIKKVLIKQQSFIESRTKSGKTLLMILAESDNNELLRELLEGSNLNLMDEDNKEANAILYAADSSNMMSFSLLLEGIVFKNGYFIQSNMRKLFLYFIRKNSSISIKYLLKYFEKKDEIKKEDLTSILKDILPNIREIIKNKRIINTLKSDLDLDLDIDIAISKSKESDEERIEKSKNSSKESVYQKSSILNKSHSPDRRVRCKRRYDKQNTREGRK